MQRPRWLLARRFVTAVLSGSLLVPVQAFEVFLQNLRHTAWANLFAY